MSRNDDETSSSMSAGPPERVPGGGVPLDEILPLVYDEVRRIARRELRREAEGHTLSTTAVAHEAYLELARLKSADGWSRPRLLAACAQVIRNVLVDHAVHRKAQKRGGGVRALSIDEVGDVVAHGDDAWTDLDDALTRLAELNPRQSRVVECRFFAGMSIEETAEALAIAPATVKRDWSIARAWLNRELSE